MRYFIALAFLGVASIVVADELTLENVTAPAANNAEEPLADAFSLAAATRFLDQASLDWTKSRQCFTCHTNFSYLMARPAVSADARAHQEVRSALEQLVEKRWPESGPRWDAEVVMSAAVLSLNDAATTGELHPTTRQALDRMWTLQRDDGGFDWLKCGWPPMESDDDYGAAVALIAAHSAPGDYLNSNDTREHLQKLDEYLQWNPPPTLHHTAMLLWADSYGAKALSQDQRTTAIERLLALQKSTGGWAIATLGDWERADGSPQDTDTCDGYATGFVIYVLRRAGVDAEHAQIQQGLDWLRANQRASGRWYTRSLNKDGKHFISHAGTAFAVLALTSCQP
jgi:squalene-hopene/tetraprenyl-beta-curcumene cyclase